MTGDCDPAVKHIPDFRGSLPKQSASVSLFNKQMVSTISYFRAKLGTFSTVNPNLRLLQKAGNEQGLEDRGRLHPSRAAALSGEAAHCLYV